MKNLKKLKIKSIEFMDDFDMVYDITVPDNHNFFMQGGILSSNCFAILDEAQNTSTEQMKMFLTRLGRNSKFSINGDPRQIDLPNGTKSGLQWAADKLRGVDPKIMVTDFSNSDVIREPIVGLVLNYLECRN